MQLPLCSLDHPQTKFRRNVFGFVQLAAALTSVAIFGGCGGQPATGSDSEGGMRPRSEQDVPGEIRRDALEEKAGLFHLKGADAPFTGTAVTRFMIGPIAITQEFKEGQLDGVEEEWLKGGSKKRSTLYRGGEAYFQTVWRADGSKKIETGLKDGKPHGTHKRWHENGKLGFEGEFYEGQFHGLLVDRDENGVLLMNARYDKGKLVEDLMPPKK